MVSFKGISQNVGINETGANPDNSAILDVSSNDKGVLIPRLTQAQRIGITGPANGLLVYQTDNTEGFWYFDGTQWIFLNPIGEFESIGGVVQNTTNINADDFVFGSTQLADLNSGATGDSRMLFDKSKSAFRAGYVPGVQWNNANIGSFSFATGRSTRASGFASSALGDSTIASGAYSTAIGKKASATATYSLAAGNESVASGFSTIALGYRANATGAYSVALGVDNTTSQLYALASGQRSTASGRWSVAMGRENTAPSQSEMVVGSFATNYTPAAMPNPNVDYNANDRIFTIGIGTTPTNRRNAMTVLKNGRIGIGTDTPSRALLEIVGFVNHTTTGTLGYLNTTGAGTVASSAQNYSIYASNRVAAQQFNAFSDARIKNIQGTSNSKEDLNTLAMIEITDYKMIDSISKGNQSIKKVIAQQVKEVYPQAVNNGLTRIIPNIYQLSEIKNGTIQLSSDVKIGDKVKLIFSENEEVVEITEVNKDNFKVNCDKEGKVFVFGTEVNDFHTVDYQAISMLNVSATQELLKRIESLEAEKTNLKEELSEQASVNDDQQKQINEIKALLNMQVDK